jgi:hypothetical protein
VADIREKVVTDLLVMLMSKPAVFLTEIPQDWVHCLHVDISPSRSSEWLDPDRDIRPMLEVLLGHMVLQNRRPIDFCAVKSEDTCSIVIRTVDG